MDNLYNISSCPHVRSKLTTQGVMTDVLIALLPTAILGVVFHGFQAFLVWFFDHMQRRRGQKSRGSVPGSTWCADADAFCRKSAETALL